MVFSVTLVCVISLIRYFTGPELALSPFYLFSIVLVTWSVNLTAGILISVASAVSWLIADLMMLDSFSMVFIPYLNETFRLIVFLFITIIIDKLKCSFENQRKLARTDHLTGIANMRAFTDYANLEIYKARRKKLPISVIYLDIDNFKQVNDDLGHPIGDELLRLVAKTLKQNIRAIDMVARYGGDEFCLLLSETGTESALLVARKLKRKLLKNVNDSDWTVTFSVGVVTYNTPPDSVDAMINKADVQMYLAKKNGKNKIESIVFAKQITPICSAEAA
jgi:diguanylate cyclase (GGDEF)-like protein